MLQRILVIITVVFAVLNWARSDTVWGKRVWDHKIDEHRRIVVDERGAPTDAYRARGRVLLGLVYHWHLIQGDTDDGQTLFTHPGYSLASGTGLPNRPVDVLFTALSGDDLLTVYNQIGKCWACLVHRRSDGSFEERPFQHDRPPSMGNTVTEDASVGPAMKEAEMARQPDGALLLRVTDQNRQDYRFTLRSWELRYEGGMRTVYYWGPVAPATTQVLSTSPEAGRRAAEAVRRCIDGRGIVDQVYPEPSQVVEREDHWEVFFDYKRKIVEVNGKQAIQMQVPSSLRVDVRKDDMTATIVPGR